MSITVTIRNAEKRDEMPVYELICQLVEFKINPENFKKTFEKNLTDPAIFYRVLEADNKVAGFVSMHIQVLLHHEGHVAEIQELCIDKKYRGMGFGKMLADEAILEAKKQKCELIELSASNKRADAHRFYEREGWDKSHLKFTKLFG